jgi:hypothetical protein
MRVSILLALMLSAAAAPTPVIAAVRGSTAQTGTLMNSAEKNCSARLPHTGREGDGIRSGQVF